MKAQLVDELVARKSLGEPFCVDTWFKQIVLGGASSDDCRPWRAEMREQALAWRTAVAN